MHFLNDTQHGTVLSTFSLFLDLKWKQRRDDLGLFRIQPRATPPAGGFSKFIFVAERLFL